MSVKKLIFRRYSDLFRCLRLYMIYWCQRDVSQWMMLFWILCCSTDKKLYYQKYKGCSGAFQTLFDVWVSYLTSCCNRDVFWCISPIDVFLLLNRHLAISEIFSWFNSGLQSLSPGLLVKLGKWCHAKNLGCLCPITYHCYQQPPRHFPKCQFFYLISDCYTNVFQHLRHDFAYLVYRLQFRLSKSYFWHIDKIETVFHARLLVLTNCHHIDLLRYMRRVFDSTVVHRCFPIYENFKNFPLQFRSISNVWD